MKIDVDDLSTTVELELDDYLDDVRTGLEKAVATVSKACLERVRAASPVRTGKYRRGWSRLLSKPGARPSAVIYNKSRPWLIHLLEDGYAKADGGRVEGHPHVKPAADRAAREFVSTVEMFLEG